MGIYNYGSFVPAGKEDTPEFAAALAKETQLYNDAKARADSLRAQTLMGGARIYNEAMGDRTPIADFLSSAFGKDKALETAGGALTTGAETAATGAIGAEAAGMAGAEAAGASLAPEVAATAAPATSAGGGLASAGLTMAPYLAGALLLNELWG